MESFPISDSHSASDGVDWAADLRNKLPALRDRPGYPTGTDEAIVAMSAPPAHAACPNPYMRNWVEAAATDGDPRADPGPFASDTTAGKTSLVYKAHSYPTKVPHEAIMRLILHYTQPGDLVLDGFCGTGMTGVAAQMCGSPNPELRTSIEAELGGVQWGRRRAVLQDLSPSATFIAAGMNLPVDAAAFDRRSREFLQRFDEELGWMYMTTGEDGSRVRVDYTVWSQIFGCPRCAGEVVFYDAAFDRQTGRVRDEFDCPSCGVALTKRLLQSREAEAATLLGDRITRPDFRPVAIAYRQGGQLLTKAPDEGDREVLRRISALSLPELRDVPLPYMHMTHERAAIYRSGFQKLHHFYYDRALATLSFLWRWALDEPDESVSRALRFWIEQGFWGLSRMNRYVATHYSQVNRLLERCVLYRLDARRTEPAICARRFLAI